MSRVRITLLGVLGVLVVSALVVGFAAQAGPRVTRSSPALPSGPVAPVSVLDASGGFVSSARAISMEGVALASQTPAPVVEPEGAPLSPSSTVIPAAVPATPPPAAPVVPLRVALIGDSLVDQSLDEQRRAFAGLGMDVSVLARPGTPLSDPWMQSAAGGAAGRDVLVVATATNDNVEAAARGVSIDDAFAAWAVAAESAVVAAGSPACVVFVDMREDASPLYRTDVAPHFNARLAAYTASRGWHVVAWSEVSRGQSEGSGWFVADELHFSAPGVRAQAGADAYAATIAAGVQAAC